MISPSLPHVYKRQPSGGALLYAWFAAMHTRVDIVLCADRSEVSLLAVADDVRTLLYRLEQGGNRYDPHSELAGLNRMAALSPCPVSPGLYDALSRCLAAYDRTGGCFDITVRTVGHTPDTIRDVCLSAQERTLFFARPGITLDLSGFLKGYALEQIRQLLRGQGLTDALVNMGNSSVLALGHHPLADGWSVCFGASADAGRTLPPLCLRDECLTTSGNDSPGRRHLIDPRTGAWIEGKRAVAVVTADGAEGEILSTALFVAGDRGRDRLRNEFRPRLILDIP